MVECLAMYTKAVANFSHSFGCSIDTKLNVLYQFYVVYFERFFFCSGTRGTFSLDFILSYLAEDIKYLHWEINIYVVPWTVKVPHSVLN